MTITKTMYVLTASGSDFKLTELKSGYVRIERMSLTSLRYMTFAKRARIDHGPKFGEIMTGVDVDTDAEYAWHTSPVMLVKGPFEVTL